MTQREPVQMLQAALLKAALTKRMVEEKLR
jgi:hypothetical protein